VTSPSLVGGDYLYVHPRWRLNEAVGSPPSVTLTDTILGSGTRVARDLSPWSYQEFGARMTYFFPVEAGRVLLGVGISATRRNYRNGYVLDPAELASGYYVATDKRRRDLLLEPTAHVVFPQLLGPAYDLRVDYRLEDNHSNDAFREFQNHVVGARVSGRF
jgi:hypothetical protein